MNIGTASRDPTAIDLRCDQRPERDRERPACLKLDEHSDEIPEDISLNRTAADIEQAITALWSSMNET
ncbi:MAG TPA: hypothetical protein ENL23_03325 [Candidatus Acetothermia bacterium]|nr:hypothetical protein [Candidatus Acetothermia bacterium]